MSKIETEDEERLKARIDSRDFHAELTGLEIGRIPRFFSQTAEALRNGKDANGKDKLSDLEWLLLNNARYAAMYHQAENVIAEADLTINPALHALSERIQLAEQRLLDMEDQASALPDGTKVFKAKNGKAYTIDGRELSQDEAKTIDWKENAASWEEYLRVKTVRDKAEQDRQEILRYQTEVIDPMRDRLRSGEAVPEQDIDDFLKQAKVQKPQALIAFQNEKTAEDIGFSKLQEARSIFGETGLNAPNIRGHFDQVKAIMDIPDLSVEPTTPKSSTVPKP